ncbi:FAD-binding oxidoreductase, partial [Leucobacter sp. M11]|uniref:FAD-binding oxidoreductase n=1 Tax=Leucobacter sp. M11 TaxID=2993565 RepID=UPI002D7F4DB1
SAFFPGLPSALEGMRAVFAERLDPAIVELLDGRTLRFIEERDGPSGALTQLPRTTPGGTPDGGGLLLLQFDGSDASAIAELARAALRAAGALRVSPAEDPVVWELLAVRKKTRGADADTQLRVGEDITVPRSELSRCVAGLEEIAERFRVGLRIIAHAGDGNLHPTFWLDPSDSARLPDLDAALDASVRLALDLGGTITGEHGVGQFKLRWFRLQHDPVSAALHARVKSAFGPLGILNPGKAFVAEEPGQPASAR